jgi:hypothetical protein
VSVEGGDLKTGWLFADRLPLAEIAKALAETQNINDVATWAEANGCSQCLSLAGGLGTDWLEVTVGASASSAISALESFGDGDVKPFATWLGSQAELRISVVLRCTADGVVGTRVCADGVGDEDITSLLSAYDLEVDPRTERVQGALQSPGYCGLEFALVDGVPRLDLLLEPGAGQARN